MKDYFVELNGSETFSTVVAVVHKTKVQSLISSYENVIPFKEESGIFGAVPRSARYLDLEDKEGNQLWRFIVLSDKLEEYLTEGRKKGLVLKKFTYNLSAYEEEVKIRAELEDKVQKTKTALA